MGDDSEFDKPVRDFIDDWPFASEYLQATLDPQLIAQHGQAMLRRALSDGRVVGFVSSGVSMAYGRLGWGKLVRTLVRVLNEPGKGGPLAELFRQDGSDQSIVKRMHEVLTALKIDSRQVGDDLQSGRFPAAFQFLEQIVLESQDKGDVPAPADETDNPLRKKVRALLHDDWGHAHILAWELAKDLQDLGSPPFPSAPPCDNESLTWQEQWSALLSNDPDDSQLTRARAARHREPREGAWPWQRLFDIDDALLDAARRDEPTSGPRVAGIAGQLINTIRDSMGVEEKKGGPVVPAPLHRFVGPALLRLSGISGRKAVPAPVPADLRSHVVPEPRDPLLLLSRELGIRRFVTTNYDLDLERLLHDRGFALAEGPDRPGEATTSRTALGDRARDGLFAPKRAIDLVHFAMQHGGAELELIHLHGRATKDDSMLITERDYQALYLQRGSAAEVVNDAIGLTFASNPMLFVGSGMNEDDILRPLRQFMAERKSRIDHTAVVLLPAEGSRARQIEEAIALYSRYGVFTMHFGLGSDRAVHAPGTERAADDVRWLACALSICRRLGSVLDAYLHAWDKKTHPDTASDELAQRAFDDAVRRLHDAVLPPGHADGTALDVDLLVHPALRIETDHGGLKLPPIIGGQKPDVRLAGPAGQPIELQLLNAVLHAVATLIDPVPGCGGLIAQQWFGRPQSAAVGHSVDAFGDDPRRLVRCLKALLDGLQDALRGLALCLELGALRDGWRTWKRDHARPLIERPVGAHRGFVRWPLDDTAASHTWRLMMRDTIALLPRKRVGLPWGQGDPDGLSTLLAVPQTDRFCDQAPSQTFQSLKKAMRETADPIAQTADALVGRRRIHLLIAPRGVGKGHFFEMMTHERCVHEFIEASWHPTNPPPVYAATMFVNLGLSLEVFSAIDRLILVLVDMARKVFPDPPDPGQRAPDEAIWDTWRKLADNRVGCLLAVLGLYARHAKSAQQRLMITFSSFGVLFDKFGDPKNALLHRVVMALLGPDSEKVPIDINLICSDAPAPRLFTRMPSALPGRAAGFKLIGQPNWGGAGTHSLRHLIQPDASERALRRIHGTVQKLNLRLAKEKERPTVQLHVLRSARAIATVSKYFPEVALAIALSPGRLMGPARSPLEPLAVVDPTFIDRLQAGLMAQLAEQEGQAMPALELLLQELGRAIKSSDPLKLPEVSRIVENWPSRERCDLSVEEQNEAEAIDQDFKLLFKVTQRSRFLLTLVCAAAAEHAWVPDQGEGRSACWQFQPDAVTDWLADLCTDLRPTLPIDRGDTTIAKVLDAFQAGHERGRLLPGFFRSHDGQRSGKADAVVAALMPLADGLAEAGIAKRVEQLFCGTLGWRLQQRILWHLAMMGLAAQADVLAIAPDIEKDCQKFAAAVLGQPKLETAARKSLVRKSLAPALVELALDVLVHRCLVFRLRPVSLGPADVQTLWRQGRDEARPTEDFKTWKSRSEKLDEAAKRAAAAPANTIQPNSGWRFAIHNFVQRAILGRLEAPFVEFPQVDQFGLSLWASQPDDLPRPNPASARDIARLVAAWTGFAQDLRTIKSVSAFHWALHRAEQSALALKEAPTDGTAIEQPLDQTRLDLWRHVTLPARMLRAAFAVVRMVYAVGVVARFHVTAPDVAFDPPEGHLVQHHLQVSWLLEQAARIHASMPLQALRKIVDADQHQPSADYGLLMEAIAPFFVDEIVWLHNECGLFHLVEGNLDDAAAQFGRALHTARQIEGEDERGALWCRIHLNLAIVDIERGRIREAAHYLDAIVQVPDENPILLTLARGFQGLVEHYSGNLDVAQRIYNDVIKALDEMEQSRSVAIFSRHLAELCRVRGAASAVDAARAIDRAIATATKGGHEDVRQLCNLSKVRLAIARMLPEDMQIKEQRLIQQNLDAVEHYGHAMGMPRLVADTAFARALLLLDMGETRHAASLTYHCLEVSNRHNLRLREMTALALLGRIYERRGMREIADPLLSWAFSVAYNCNYSNMRESVPRSDAPVAAPRGGL